MQLFFTKNIQFYKFNNISYSKKAAFRLPQITHTPPLSPQPPPHKQYTVSLNLDNDDQLLVQKMNEDDNAEETAELLKDLFPDFSYVKRKRKPKKD